MGKLYWHHAREGVYTVKTGYALAEQLTRDEENVETGQWNLIWKLKVPPRIRDGTWRLCRNVLPTRANLVRKHIGQDISCVICEEGQETVWHTFFNCPFALDVWRIGGLEDRIEECITRIESTSSLIFTLLYELNEEEGAKFAMLLNQIWRERNRKLWEGCIKPATQLVIEATMSLREWQHASKPAIVNRTTRCGAWHKPDGLCLKLNVDAAFFEETMETGIGMVLRDSEGTIIATRSKRIPGMVDVDVGEALGFLEAVSWAHDMGLERVIIEGDAKLVVDAIRSREFANSSFGDIIRECSNFLHDLNGFSVNLVKRSANIIAHSIARASRHYESSMFWSESPDFVVDLPLETCTCGAE